MRKWGILKWEMEEVVENVFLPVTTCDMIDTEQVLLSVILDEMHNVDIYQELPKSRAIIHTWVKQDHLLISGCGIPDP